MGGVQPRYEFVLLMLVAMFSPLGSGVAWGQGCVTNLICVTSTGSTFKTIATNQAPGTNFSNLIASGKLLGVAASATTPQYLYICGGSIVVDIPNYTFAAGSEIIFSDALGEIAVTGTSKLVIQGTFLHGCTKLWNKVRLKPGAQLDISDSRIEDAQRGIVAESSSKLFVKNCNFNGNHISIYAGSNVTTIPTDVIMTITGCIFSGSKTLVEPFFEGGDIYYKPLFGVYLYNVKNTSIGNSNAPMNEFRDFSASSANFLPTGIRCVNGNLSVSNTRFKNIGYDAANVGNSVGYGIDCVETIFLPPVSIPFILNVKGIGKNNTLPTFDKVGTAISTFESVKISNSYIKDVLVGIRIIQNLPSANSVVSDNTFEKFYCDAIYAPNLKSSNGLSIGNNDFLDNAPSFSYQNLIRRHIMVGSASNVTNKNIKITANKFSMLNNDINNSERSCVRVTNLNGTIVKSNTFSDASSDVSNTSLIYAYNSSLTAYTNTFSGSGSSFFATHKSQGIFLQDSPNCDISCNTLNNLAKGMYFKGQNCSGMKLIENNFKTHALGLGLSSDAIIGEQIKRNNSWGVTTNLPNSEATFEGRNQSLVGDFIFVGMSRFGVQNNSVSLPYPRFVGTEPDMGWFKPSSVGPGVTYCGIEYPIPSIPKLSVKDSFVVDGLFPSYLGYAASTWEANLTTLDRLTDNPTLRPAGTAAAAFYNAQQNTASAKLLSVSKGLATLHTPTTDQTAALEMAKNKYMDNVEKVNTLDSALAVAQTPAARLAILNARTSLMVSLQQANDTYVAASVTIANSINEKKQQLQTLLGSIVTTAPYEEDYKTVCSIALQNSGGSQLSTADQSVLLNIAHKCRFESGLAVVMARGNITGEINFDAYDNCKPKTEAADANERNQMAATPIANEGITVAPNPAQNNIIVGLSNIYTVGTAQLFSVSGTMVASWRLDGTQRVNLTWESLPIGLYFLKVNTDNAGNFTPIKVMIEK